MKQKLITILSGLATLSAAPTAWAIYAGVRKIDVFPMWTPAAIAGAVAVIATSIAAGLLVTDIKTYNQGMKNKTEREELGMSAGPAWLVLGGCVLAEVTLSLLIVVIPGALPFGVLVFPLMTLAGVFAFAVRFDLQERIDSREAERAAEKAEHERIKAERKAEKLTKKQEKPATEPAAAAVQPAQPAFVCNFSGCKAKPFGSQAALNAHQRKHKQITGYAVSFEPISAEKK